MEGRIVELKRGRIVNALAAGTDATATSKAQKAKGHNSVIIYATISGSGTWTVKIQGAPTPTGTYIDMYKDDGNAMSIASATASKAQVFRGIPENFKIVATEDVSGATITVDYELITL